MFELFFCCPRQDSDVIECMLVQQAMYACQQALIARFGAIVGVGEDEIQKKG
jgi:hypothetical protein